MDKTKITVPEGVEYIAVNAFLPSLLSLTEVKLPKSLKRIGDEAFMGCINLQKVSLPKKNNLTVVGSNAFSNCLSLQSMSFANPMEFGSSIFYKCDRLTLKFTSTELPVGTAALDVNAIIVPKESVDEYKKLYNSDEENIFGDDKLVEDNFISNDGVTLDKYIGAELEVTTPKSLTKVNGSAFRTSTVEKLTLTSTVTELNGSLSELTNLREITLSSNITTIPDYCFSQLKKLTNVNIPQDSKLTTIGDNAFYMCSRLSGLNLPSSITSIGTSVLRNVQI